MPKGYNKSFNAMNPGPGSYNNQETLDKKGMIMPVSKRKANYSNTPGPGEYQNDLNRKTNQWTFARNKDPNQDSKVPGPGQYNVDNQFNQWLHQKPMQNYIWYETYILTKFNIFVMNFQLLDVEYFQKRLKENKKRYQ